jgi:hypothetical protein
MMQEKVLRMMKNWIIEGVTNLLPTKNKKAPRLRELLGLDECCRFYWACIRAKPLTVTGE